MKKGFTLMEILFVLLVIALVVSFAVPAIRTVRYDMYNARAKSALRKLAEARMTYYQATKGSDITGVFLGSDVEEYASSTCNGLNASGIPGSRDTSDVSQLFACGFLDWRDFDKLPYKFTVCTASNTGSKPCISSGGTAVYAGASGSGSSGKKYNASYGYYMVIGVDRQVKDNLD